MYDESWYTGGRKYMPHIDFAIHAHDRGCGAGTSRCSEIGRCTLRGFSVSSIRHSHGYAQRFWCTPVLLDVVENPLPLFIIPSEWIVGRMTIVLHDVRFWG
jgi:hypothetical protein